jgi:hypothetical protein
LEWEYPPTPVNPPVSAPPPKQLPAYWALPSKAVLQRLEEQAEFGDLVALRATLAEARAASSTAEDLDFLNALETFAGHARLSTLREWIQAALERSTPTRSP